MTNQITAAGLQINTAAETTADLVAGAQGIYGADINVDQNSPDGQIIGIAAQAITDLLEFIAAVNSGFDPDQAIGVILDQRVAYNNIQRQGGTYTVQPIDITVDTTVTLAGLDAAYSDPNGTGYTVQDASGNRFILATTITLTPGTTECDFRAQQIGIVNVPIDTITTPITIVLGVTAVNNSSAAISVGQTQETDQQLRVRRQKSVSLATTGYLNGLLAAILALSGVTEAVLYDNRTSAEDENGIPAHAIWLIVTGGSNVDIANTIYNRISDGCNMKGDITYDITTASGAVFTAKWDNPIAEDLYIQFTIQTTVPGFNFSEDAIKSYMVENLVYGIGQAADTSAVTIAALAGIASQGGGGVPIMVAISNNGIDLVDYLTTTGLDYQFTLDPSRIDISVV